MASNYTENYDLCQWEATDQVLREEFNQDNAKVDAALKELMDKDTALDSAIAAVAATAGNCQMELITYTGTGTSGTEDKTKIQFSELPDVFIVAGDLAVIMGKGGDTKPLFIYDDPVYHETFVSTATAQWNGAKLILSSSKPRLQMNTSGIDYWALGLHIKT